VFLLNDGWRTLGLPQRCRLDYTICTCVKNHAVSTANYQQTGHVGVPLLPRTTSDFLNRDITDYITASSCGLLVQPSFLERHTDRFIAYSHSYGYTFTAVETATRNSFASSSLVSGSAQLLHNCTKTAFEKDCNRRMSLKVTQGHRKWRSLIGHIIIITLHVNGM